MIFFLRYSISAVVHVLFTPAVAHDFMCLFVSQSLLAQRLGEFDCPNEEQTIPTIDFSPLETGGYMSFRYLLCVFFLFFLLFFFVLIASFIIHNIHFSPLETTEHVVVLVIAACITIF